MVQKFIGIVKQQIEYWKYQVAHFGPDHPRYRPAKISKYEYLIKDFSELLDHLEREAAQNPVDKGTSLAEPSTTFFVRPKRSPFIPVAAAEPLPATASTPTALPDDIPDDLADLPPELLNELSESIKGETDQLIKIINGRGGTATLDEILIDLYRKYKEVGKRPIISNKLYRLSRRGLCWPIPGKKGIYTTTKPTDGDGAPPTEDDDGPGTPETSSNKSEPPTKAPHASPNKVRRDLYASTAIPSTRLPH